MRRNSLDGILNGLIVFYIVSTGNTTVFYLKDEYNRPVGSLSIRAAPALPRSLVITPRSKPLARGFPLLRLLDDTMTELSVLCCGMSREPLFV